MYNKKEKVVNSIISITFIYEDKPSTVKAACKALSAREHYEDADIAVFKCCCFTKNPLSHQEL